MSSRLSWRKKSKVFPFMWTVPMWNWEEHIQEPSLVVHQDIPKLQEVGWGFLFFSFKVKGHFWVASSLCSKVRLSAKPLIWKLFFYCHVNKTHLHNNVFAISLVWKVRVFGTRKWPVAWFMYSQPGYEELFKYSLLQTRLMSCAFSKLQFFNVKGKNTLR